MNRPNSLPLLLILVPILLTACVTTSPLRNSQPISAGFLYESSYINVRSPNSDGWHLLGRSQFGMAFAKGGVETNESFAAQLFIFPLEQTKSTDEFLTLIKQGFKNDTSSERYEAIKSEFEYSDKRSYPCIKITSTVNDKKAHISPTQRAALLLQINALYCRHPKEKGTGFAISFSHRGEAKYSNLAVESQRFIKGVQVPGY